MKTIWLAACLSACLVFVPSWLKAEETAEGGKATADKSESLPMSGFVASITSREELRKKGREYRDMFRGEMADGGSPAPDFDPIELELDYGFIRSRDLLSKTDKAIVALTAVAVSQNLTVVPQVVEGALNSGLEPRAILEVFVQISIYTGFVKAEPLAALAREVFEERGVSVDETTLPFEDYDLVTQKHAEVYGSLHGNLASAPETAFVSRLYPPIGLYTYGVVLRRPGLNVRERMIVVIACLTVQGGMEVLLPGAFKTSMSAGLSIDEIAEVAIQTVPFTGSWPAGKLLIEMEKAFPGGKLPE
ncbi:MAG: hypothetical protein AAGC77_12835 [Pseudomonadota bacterium]